MLPLPFYGMCLEDLRKPVLIAPSQPWHGDTPSTGVDRWRGDYLLCNLSLGLPLSSFCPGLAATQTVLISSLDSKEMPHHSSWHFRWLGEGSCLAVENCTASSLPRFKHRRVHRSGLETTLP